MTWSGDVGVATRGAPHHVVEPRPDDGWRFIPQPRTGRPRLSEGSGFLVSSGIPDPLDLFGHPRPPPSCRASIGQPAEECKQEQVGCASVSPSRALQGCDQWTAQCWSGVEPLLMQSPEIHSQGSGPQHRPLVGRAAERQRAHRPSESAEMAAWSGLATRTSNPRPAA